jgi:excinuclease ABC subunit A
VLFIFDEPTTGLHFHDIEKLLSALGALIEQGNTVLVIEHNLEIVKNADWIIDLGPEGGDQGGQICFAGTPEELVKVDNNHTARFLKEKL